MRRVRAWAVELDGVEPRARRAPSPELLPREALLAPRRPRPALARGAAAGRHLARGRAGRPARAPLGAARHGRHLRAAQPRLDARHVRRAGAGGGSRADRRLHAARRRRARRRRGRGARDRRGLGARRAAGDRLARLRAQGRQDRRARQRVRERGEARGPARRRDRPAGRPVRGGRRRRRRGRPARSSSSSSPRRASTAPTPSAASSRRSRRPRRSRPSTSCCSATPRRSPAQVRNAGAVFVGPWSPVAAGDYATGGNHVLPTSGWARSVGGLGLETFLKPVTTQRLTAGGPRAAAADGRGARRRRGHAGARRGGAAMRALSPEFRAYTWAPPTDEVARLAGIDPSQVSASTRTRRRCRCPRAAAGNDRRRARVDQQLPARRLPRAARAIAAYDGVEPENVVLGAGADDLILLCARCFAGPGDTIAIPERADLPALPDRRPARGRRGRRRRPGAHLHLPAEQPDGELAAAARRRARSSSTRRTSSTAARRRSRCSTTA